MIVVDTSAVVAIARLEGDAPALARRIDNDRAPQISGANVLECSLVLRSFRQLPPRLVEERLDALLANIGFVVHAITLEDIALARDAHVRYSARAVNRCSRLAAELRGELLAELDAAHRRAEGEALRILAVELL